MKLIMIDQKRNQLPPMEHSELRWADEVKKPRSIPSAAIAIIALVGVISAVAFGNAVAAVNAHVKECESSGNLISNDMKSYMLIYTGCQEPSEGDSE